MGNFLTKIKLIVSDSNLRARLLFILGALVFFRLLAAIPIPGIDKLRLEAFFSGNQFLGLLNVFSGGGLSTLSIVMLGVGPYITASIIMQLLTMMVPALKALYHEEGEAGRKRFAQYSRLITVPLAVIQAISFIIILERQQIIPHLGLFAFGVNVIVITAGSILLMWVGELMTEFGIGNGVSLIIFAGIVSIIPTMIGQLQFTFDPAQIPLYLMFLVASLLIIAGVVVVSEAERPIPITYAKRVRGAKMYGGVSTYLPLRVNQAGVIPIIFALSILLFPQLIFQFLTTVQYPWVAAFARGGMDFLANGWAHSIIYFLLVFLFTYFYTAVQFDPDALATNLQKGGAFIPGVRPGASTSTYIAKILTRITLVGATFLGLIAVLPFAMQQLTSNQSLAIGGTALLIAVSVVLDLVKKIQAQISMREY